MNFGVPDLSKKSYLKKCSVSLKNMSLSKLMKNMSCKINNYYNYILYTF